MLCDFIIRPGILAADLGSEAMRDIFCTSSKTGKT